MARKPPTKRQQYWLKHLRAAASFDGSMAAYASHHQVDAKDLYRWKTKLKLFGLTPDTAGVKQTSSIASGGTGFATVKPAASAPCMPGKACVVLPNGCRIELHGVLDRTLIRELIAATSGAL